MSKTKNLVLALGATAILGTAAFAVNAPSKESAANHDFGKLSVDGVKAYRDVRMARLAIFEGHIKEAKTEISQAQASFAKAKTDDTVFTKAEADLKPPAGMTQPGSDKTASTTPISWIPVDGGMSLTEDYSAAPDKAAGVAKANEQLKNGNQKQAMDALKLAHVNALFITEVVPLDKTISGVDKADSLIGSGKYYEANQTLKDVEDSARFDETDFFTTPEKTASAASTSKTAATTPAASAAKPDSSK